MTDIGVTRRRPLGRGILHVAIVLSVAFAVLAGAAGYWGVVRSSDLNRSPYDPAIIAASRTVPRGEILDRDGEVLASNEQDANGEYYRVYPSDALSHVIGYASQRYGRAGLERAFDAELAGLAGDPLTDALRKFGASRYDPKTLTTSLSYDLQRAAVRGPRGPARCRGHARSADRGGPRPRIDADVRRVRISDPTTAEATFGRLRDDKAQPLLPRATLGRYVPGSVFKIVTAVAGLGSGAIDTVDDVQEAAAGRGEGSGWSRASASATAIIRRPATRRST